VKAYVRSAAGEDILRQYRYYLLERDAAQVAQRFLDAVQSAIEELCRAPGLGAPRPLKNAALAGLRSWPVRGFPSMRIFYLLSGDKLRVVRVLHGRRDIAALLEKEPEDE